MKIDIATSKGVQSVDADEAHGFAIHPTPLADGTARGFSVTHRETGFAVVRCVPLQHTARCIAAIAAVMPIGWKTLTLRNFNSRQKRLDRFWIKWVSEIRKENA